MLDDHCLEVCAGMEGSVEVPLVDVKPEEKQPLNENAASKPDYGTGTSKPDFLEDLDPSDPNFWREVSLSAE